MRWHGSELGGFTLLQARRHAFASAAAYVRVHGAALRSSPGRAALACLGLALGVTVAVAVAVVVSSLGRPFAGYAGLPHPPQLQVRAVAEHGLPEDAYRRVRAVPGVHAAPVSGGPAVVAGPAGSSGVLLLGATCEAAVFTGALPCDTGGAAATAPTGVPLWIPAAVADAIGVHPGDVVSIPGQGPGAAYVGGVLDVDTATAVNDGRVAFGLVPDVAALVGHPGTLAAVLVGFDGPDADAEPSEAALRSSLGDAAIVEAPASFEPPILQAARRALLLNGAIAIAVGILVATTTLVTVFTDRQHTFAVLGVIGATRRGSAAGLVAEGAGIGLVASALGIGPGLLAGRALTTWFGDAVLAGSGFDVQARLGILPWSVALGVGVIGGAAAAAISAWAALRRPVLDVLADASRFAMPPRPRYGLVPVGAVMLAIGLGLAVPFGAGRLPLVVGFAALALMPVGFALLVMGATPALVNLYRTRVPFRSAVGLLARSELSRSPVQTGAAVVILALAVSTFAPSMNLRTFASEAIASRGTDLIGAGLLVGAREVGEQSSASLSSDALAGVAAVPGVASVTPVLRAPLALETPAVVVGLPAGTGLLAAEAARSGLSDDDLAAMAAGGLVLSDLAAAHLRTRAGGTVDLPVNGGHATFPVVAVADPSFVDDTGIGDAIVADADVAERTWGAVPTFALVSLDPGAGAGAVAAAVEAASDGRVAAMTSARFDELASGTVARFLAPVIDLGWVVVVAAAIGVLNLFVLGLVQRRRERALHRAIGMDTRQEYATALTESVAVGLLGAAFGALATLAFSLQLSIVAPVFLTTSVGWRPLPGPLGVAVVGAVAAGLLGVAAPLLQRRRGDVDTLLRGD